MMHCMTCVGLGQVLKGGTFVILCESMCDLHHVVNVTCDPCQVTPCFGMVVMGYAGGQGSVYYWLLLVGDCMDPVHGG